MARRPLTKSPVPASDGPVTAVAVPARSLVSLASLEPPEGLPAGSLVRLFPPAGATDLEVEHAVRRLHEAGALAVRVQPRSREGAPLLRRPEAHVQPGLHSVRETVLSMAKTARNVDNRALTEYLEGVLEKVL